MWSEREHVSAAQDVLGEVTAEPRATGSRRTALGGVAGGLALAASGLLLPARLVDETAAANPPSGRIQKRKGQQRDKQRRRREHRRDTQRRKADQRGAQDDKPRGGSCLNCGHLVRWVEIDNQRSTGMWFELQYLKYDADLVSGKWKHGGYTEYNVGKTHIAEWHSAECLYLRDQGQWDRPEGRWYIFSLCDNRGLFDQVGLLTLATGGTINGKEQWGWRDEPPIDGDVVVKNHELHELGYYDWYIDDVWFRIARRADDTSIHHDGYQATLTIQRRP